MHKESLANPEARGLHVDLQARLRSIGALQCTEQLRTR
jgi:hypothetical protein